MTKCKKKDERKTELIKNIFRIIGIKYYEDFYYEDYHEEAADDRNL